MGVLYEVVHHLAQRDGVEAVVVLSADGLAIEQASRGSVDAESLAALTATFLQHAGRLGAGTDRGVFRTAVCEYDQGLLIIAQVGSGESLAILAASQADVGLLLHDLRQHRPALAALL